MASEFDPKKQARIDIKKRRHRDEVKISKRSIREQEWDDDFDLNQTLKKNQK